MQSRSVHVRHSSSNFVVNVTSSAASRLIARFNDHRQRRWRDGLPCDSAGRHATMGPWDCSSVFALMLSPPYRDGPCATAARASARLDLPAPPSLRTWLFLYLRQHAAHERQQLV